MTTPLALQIYSIREEMKADFAGSMRQVAGMGYPAVEVAALPDTVSPAQAKAVFDDCGLTVIAAHHALSSDIDRGHLIETIKTLGHQRLVCPWLDPERYFSSIDGIKQACALLNEINHWLQDRGTTLLYHNHWFEFEPIDGKIPFDIMLDGLDESIEIELDTYWVMVGGQDPIQVLRQLGARASLLHVKDGPADSIEASMTAVGQGTVDYHTIIGAAQSDWLIVELDRCDTDMLTAVEESAAYLIEQRLGEGRTA